MLQEKSIEKYWSKHLEIQGTIEDSNEEDTVIAY